MGEKRGNTGKLRYDFNTAGVLEVCIKGNWYRASAREFRSYNGQRRISEPQTVVLGNADVSVDTYDYTGPVYVFNTNIEVELTNEGRIVNSSDWDKARRLSKKRGL